MQTAGTAHTHSNLAHRRHAGARRPRQAGSNRDAAKKTMFRVIAGKHDLKQRVMPPRQTLESRRDAGAVVLIETVKLADRPFFNVLAGIEGAFEHAFAMRRHQEIGADAANDVERFAKERARNFQFVIAQAEIETGGDQHRRVIADADGDIEGFAARMRLPRQHGKVMVRRDADEGAVAIERHQPCDREIGLTGVPVLGNDRAGGDVGAALVFKETRYRQFADQIRVRDDFFLARCRCQHAMRQRRFDRANNCALQLRLRRPEPHGEPRQRIKQIADNRHFVSADVFET